MRLNGWQGIGIVASVIWAIGAPIYLDSIAERDAVETFVRYHQACMEDNPSSDFEQCFERAHRASDTVPRYPLLSANGAVAGLVPVGLGWLLAYALIYLVRWIRAGFPRR